MSMRARVLVGCIHMNLGRLRKGVSIATALILLVSLLQSSAVLAQTEDREEEIMILPRIGIIGSGISGASSAYFLRQLFGKKAVIDVYESEKIGGRMSVVEMNGLQYESGASIIHGKNRYMVDFAKTLNNGLPRKDMTAGTMGLYTNEGVQFETSSWLPVTLAKLFWRYWTDVYNVRHMTGDFLEEFMRIYQFQDNGIAFTTVEDMLLAMGPMCLNATRRSLRETLQQKGFSARFVDELAMAAARNNYGQTPDNLHGFVGAVSLIGVEPDLWSVHGGNYQVPVYLLKQSQANVRKATVTTVALIRGGGEVSYELEFKQGEKTLTHEYDIVVLATPPEGSKSTISFEEFPVPLTPFQQPYHTTVALFVEGQVNSTYLGLASPEDVPTDLFSVSTDVPFSSMSKLSPTDPSELPDKPFSPAHDVWKVFLNQEPSQELIAQLFPQRESVKMVKWKAYPEYSPNMDLPPFMLYDRLYYVNAIESAAAAMEMNAIGAKNVALLAYNHWHGHLDKIDEHQLPSESDQKSEL